MRAQRNGSVVNISSIDALSPLNGLSAYAASKWGLRGMTKTLALELGSAGIRVNCVCPSDGSDEMAAAWAEPLQEMSDQVAGYLGQQTPGLEGLKATSSAAAWGRGARRTTWGAEIMFHGSGQGCDGEFPRVDEQALLGHDPLGGSVGPRASQSWLFCSDSPREAERRDALILRRIEG